jgi:uncharacterized protein
MPLKVLSGYIALIVLSFLAHSGILPPQLSFAAMPALMFALPLLAKHPVRIVFSVRHILLGSAASLIVLLPYAFFFGADLRSLSSADIVIQFLAVALPEEIFFRGFIQDSIGRNRRSVFLASLLFALAHLPKAFLSGDWISLLSFFPSLVMGWLYMRSGNVVPGTIFHLAANLVHLSLRY